MTISLFGVYFDVETETYYLRARYYSPGIGRFITEDPIRDGLNWYTYCGNNPVTRMDPNGMTWTVDAALPQSAQDLISIYTQNWLSASPDETIWDPMTGQEVNAREYWHNQADNVRMVYLRPVLSAAMKQLRDEGILDKNFNLTRKICEGFTREEFIYAYAGMLLDPDFASKYDGSMPVEVNVYRYYTQEVCFVEGTLIATDKGKKEIQNIKVGDIVYSQNVYTGEQGLKKVTNVFENKTDTLIHITIGKDVFIDATPTHPFWVESRGWTMAAGLCIGDKVILLNGESKEVTNVIVEKYDRPIKVYNFEVEDWHTYFVSEDSILVHNTCNVSSGSLISGMALQAGLNWLGEGYREISPGVFRSADNTRQFRMTNADLTGAHGSGPHIHFESIGPDGKTIIENGHVDLEDEMRKMINSSK